MGRALSSLTIVGGLVALVSCSAAESGTQGTSLDELRSMQPCDAMVPLHARVVETDTRALPEDRTLALEYWRSIWLEADTQAELRASCPVETMELVAALGLQIFDDPSTHRLPRSRTNHHRSRMR